MGDHTHWLMNITWSSKHEHSHSGTVHKCDKCDYEHTDERYLRQHMNSHLQVKQYKCKIYGQGFVYSIQLKRHYDNAECK